MIKEFAEIKSQDQDIVVYLGEGLIVKGKILEISPETLVVDMEGKRTVVQSINIRYFHNG